MKFLANQSGKVGFSGMRILRTEFDDHQEKKCGFWPIAAEIKAIQISF